MVRMPADLDTLIFLIAPEVIAALIAACSAVANPTPASAEVAEAAEVT